MMRFLLVVLLCLAGFRAGYAEETSLSFVTEESPPGNYTENGHIVGIAADLMQAILKRTGLVASVEMLPWQRAYQQALDDPRSCVFATSMTEERRPLFKWVGPLFHVDWALLSAKDRTITLKSIEDARPYTIGVLKGDARESWLSEHGFQLERVAAADKLGPMLAMGRIDLWASSTSRLSLMRMGGDTSLHLALAFNRTDLGLACNLAVDDTTLRRMALALETLRKDGTVARLETVYGLGAEPRVVTN